MTKSKGTNDKGNPNAEGAPARGGRSLVGSSQRPRKTRADLEREASEICSRTGPKINFTAAIKQLKTK